MIFSRRAIQKRLDMVRERVGDEAATALAARLNRAGRDRLAAMWEVVVIAGLVGVGQLRHEEPLPSGRRPDIGFSASGLAFVADVTAVSDEGLDESNPYFELSQAIEAAETKLGLPIGGLDLRVEEAEVRTARGARRLLRLPPRGRIDAFVRTTIVPSLQAQIAAGATVLRLEIDDADVGISIAIDPAKSPYSTGSYGAYASPTIKDHNPLYRALKAKAAQLKGASDYTGVIVGDASSASMRPRSLGHQGLDSQRIAGEFLRQHSSVGFVCLLTISETRTILQIDRPARRIDKLVVTRDGDALAGSLNATFGEMIARMPAPIRMPINAALRAREDEYDLGFHGGYRMQSSKVRISSRELVEVLAGRRTLADNGAKYVDRARVLGAGEPNRVQALFDRYLREGRLPDAIEVIKGADDEEDDWIEFDFSKPDAAISPFR